MSVFNFFELKSQPSWDQYVIQHPDGSVFHLSAMFRAFEESEGYAPFNIAACNCNGQIVAILAAVKVDQTSEGPLGKSTSRSVMYAEPLCNDTNEGRSALVQLLNMYDRVWSKESLFSEIRPLNYSDQQAMIFLEQDYQKLRSRNLVIDLSRPTDSQHHQQPQAHNETVESLNQLKIDSIPSNSSFDRVIEFLQICSRTSNSLGSQIGYLKTLIEHLPPEIVRVRIASINGTDVAISIGLIFKGRFISWFKMASDAAKSQLISALTWDEINEARRLQLSRYHLGGFEWNAESLCSKEIESSFDNQKISRFYYKKIGAKLNLALQQKEEFVHGRLPKLSLGDAQPPKGAHYD